jgi:fatty-acyl-CoA synthase
MANEKSLHSAHSRLLDLLDADPLATAFISNGSSVTRQEFRQNCLRMASWLQSQGVTAGDNVAVWLMNRMEWPMLLFALTSLGAALVAVNTRYRSEELKFILKKSNARFLVMQSSFQKVDFLSIAKDADLASLPKLEKVLLVGQDNSTTKASLGRETIAMPSSFSTDVLSAIVLHTPSRPAILFSTSGTTSGPKLAIHTEHTLSTHARRCAVRFKLNQPQSCYLAMLPFCGVFGLAALISALAAGAPVVMMDAFDAPQAIGLISDFRVTHTFGSDEMVKRLLEGATDDSVFKSLQVFGFGAFTSNFGQVAKKAIERGLPLIGIYGSSEVLALFAAQNTDAPLELRIQAGGIPVASPDAAIRVRDPESGALLPVGTSGTIEISSPSQFVGYYEDPQATNKAITEDGWVKTGDLGYQIGNGFVFESRFGDAIRLGGFLVDPAEIESSLAALDDVDQAYVVEIEIDGRSRVVAFVKGLEYPGRAENLITEMRSRVASYKVPACVWFIGDFPMVDGPNGAKIQRNRLREMALQYLTDK